MSPLLSFNWSILFVCLFLYFANFPKLSSVAAQKNNKNKNEYSLLIKKINESFTLDLVSPLRRYFPQISQANSAGIEQCFDAMLNGERISLFDRNASGGDVVLEYFSALPDHVPSNQTIQSLFESIHTIVDYVVQCSQEITAENDKLTKRLNITFFKVGLTSMSDMSHKEMERLTGSDSDVKRERRQVESNQKQSPNNSSFNNFYNSLLKMMDRFYGRSRPTPRPNPQPRQFPFRYPYPYSNPKGIGNCPKTSALRSLPRQWDWRSRGVVTPVRNQVTCGSCWAFTTCQTIESAMLIANRSTNRNLELSTQQLIDWDVKARGCDGGSAPTAYEYVRRNGLTEARNYPYVNRKNRPNQKRRNLSVAARIKDYCIRGNIHGPKRVHERLTDEDIMRALVEHGPLYSLVYGEGSILQNYKSGVLDDPRCSKETNHAVVLVGYDERSWILKNSWGTRWGERGYFRLVRGKNMCGINTEIAYAIL